MLHAACRPLLLAALAVAAFLAPPAVAQQVPEDGRGQGLFDRAWHAGRRAALRETFLDKARDEDGVIVLRGAGEIRDYREFRQDNNFWYFTGITTPNAVYVSVPSKGEEYLLVPLVGAMEERWNGDLIDPQEAKELTGIEVVTKLSQGGETWGNLEALLENLAKEHDTFYVQMRPAENWMMSRDQLMSWESSLLKDPFDGRKSRGQQFAEQLRERYDVEVRDVTLMLDNLRLRKTPEELEAMRRACAVSGAAHEEVMRTAVPGDYEWELAATMTGAMLERGAMGPAYMAIVGSGPNACVLHYSRNDRALQEGDVVMIDYGAEYNHYVADISRAWPVNRTWSEREREIYQAVYDAQEAAFAECKPGSTLAEVHRAARKLLDERGFGEAFWHSTSHWLGMATHDVGAFRAVLEPGMVFTIEPGVYLPDEGIGVRIEDVVVITEDGFELLSDMIPRDPDAIEALRAEAWDAYEASARSR